MGDKPKLSLQEARSLFKADLNRSGIGPGEIRSMGDSYKEAVQQAHPEVNMGVAGNEYDAPNREIEGNFVEDLGTSFYNSFVDLAEGVGNAIPTMAQAVGSDNKFWDSWMDGVSTWSDNRKGILSDAANKPLTDGWGNLNAWAAGLGQGGGFIASMFLGGAGFARGAKALNVMNDFQKAQKVGNIVSGTLSMTPAIYDEAINAGISKSNAARLALGISSIVSLTEGAALEWMGKSISKPVTTKAAQESFKESLAKFSTKELTEKSFDDVIKLTGLKFGERMKAVGPKAFEGMAVEGTQEFSQTYIEEGIKQLYDTIFAPGKKKGEGAFGADVMSWGTFKEAVTGGVLGSVLGGTLTTAGSLASGVKGETLFAAVEHATKTGNTKVMDRLRNDIQVMGANKQLKDSPEAIIQHVNEIHDFVKKTDGLNLNSSTSKYQMYQMMQLEDKMSELVNKKFEITDDLHDLVGKTYKKNIKMAGQVSGALNEDMKMIIDENAPLDKKRDRFEDQLGKYVGLYKSIMNGKITEKKLEEALPKVSYALKAQLAEKKKSEKKSEESADKTTVENNEAKSVVAKEQTYFSYKGNKVSESAIQDRGKLVEEMNDIQSIEKEDERDQKMDKFMDKLDKDYGTDLDTLLTMDEGVEQEYKAGKLPKVTADPIKENTSLNERGTAIEEIKRVLATEITPEKRTQLEGELKILEGQRDFLDNNTTQLKETSVPQQEFDDFVNTGTVSEERLKTIAGKVKRNETMDERESAIFQNKTGEVEKIIKDQTISVDRSVLDLADTDTMRARAASLQEQLDNETDPVRQTEIQDQLQKINSELQNNIQPKEAVQEQPVSNESVPTEEENETDDDFKKVEDFRSHDMHIFDKLIDDDFKIVIGKNPNSKDQRAVKSVQVSQAISANPVLYNKIKGHLAKVFPWVPVRELDNLSWKYGPNVLGRISEIGIELNKDTAIQSTIAHEYAEVYVEVLGKNDPLVQLGVEMIKDTPYMQWAKTMYPELSENGQANEALREAVGQDTVDKLQVRFQGNQMQKFIFWAQKFWNKLRSLFRAQNASDVVSLISDGLVYAKKPFAKDMSLLRELNSDQRQDARFVEALNFLNTVMVRQKIQTILNDEPLGSDPLTKNVYGSLLQRFVDEKTGVLPDGSIKIFDQIADSTDVLIAVKEGRTAQAARDVYMHMMQQDTQLFNLINRSIVSFAKKSVSKSDEIIQDELFKDPENNSAVKATQKVSESVRSVITSLLDREGRLMNADRIYQYITAASKNARTNPQLMEQLEKDAKTGSHPEADRLFAVLSGLDNSEKQSVLTELRSLIGIKYVSSNFTQAREKGGQKKFDEQGNPVYRLSNQVVNKDQNVEDQVKEMMKSLDEKEHVEAIRILDDLRENYFNELNNPTDYVYNQIKKVFDLSMDANIDMSVVKELVEKYNAKRNGFANFISSKYYNTDTGYDFYHVLTHDISANKIKSILKNIIVANQGIEKLQNTFVNKTGNKVSSTRFGYWITQVGKLINEPAYREKMLANPVYKNNPVLKYFIGKKGIDWFVHDAISNEFKNKAVEYTGQVASDTAVLGLSRFSNNTSDQFYAQNVGITADRGHSSWFNVPRIKRDKFADAYRDRANIEQKSYDQKIKGLTDTSKVDAFFNNTSLNKIVNGKVVTPFEEGYPKAEVEKIKGRIGDLTNLVEKLGFSEAMMADQKYTAIRELVADYYYNDSVNRSWLTDIVSGPALNLKDVSDVVKRMGGINSGGKNIVTEKPVYVFAVKSLQKDGVRVNSDSFSFNGTHFHQNIVEQSGSLDKVGANVKDQLYQVNPSTSKLEYLKMSSIGLVGDNLSEMSHNGQGGYADIGKAIKAIEAYITQTTGDEKPYVKIVDNKSFKGVQPENVIDLNDFISKSPAELIGKAEQWDFNNYSIAFNINKDLREVPLEEQTVILSTQESKIALNFSTDAELQQMENEIVSMLKKEMGVRGDDYSEESYRIDDKKFSTLYGKLKNQDLLLSALTKNVEEDEKNSITDILFDIVDFNKENPNNPIISFDHPNLVNIVQQFVASKLTKKGIRSEISGAYLHMMPNYGSDLKWYDHTDDGKLLSPAEVALPWSMFAESKKAAEHLLKEKPELFKTVCVRVPASGAMSTFVGQVKYFTDGGINSAIVPDEFINVSDADHDADKLFVYRADINSFGEVNDSDKTKIFNSLYDRISSPELVLGTKNSLELDTMKADLKAMGFDKAASYSLSDYADVANIHDQMSFGGEAIGIMAIATKMLSVLSQSKEQLVNPIMFNGEELQKFKNLSLDDQARLLQAALDMAKDPILPSTGINRFTINVATTLTLLGVSINETAKFLNDSAIVDLVKLIEETEGNYRAGKKKPVTQIVSEYKKSLDAKTTTLTTPEMINTLVEKHGAKAYLKGDINTEDVFKTKDGSMYYRLEPIEGKPDQYHISIVPKPNLDSLEKMEKFSEIQKISDDIKKLIPLMQLDNKLPNNGKQLHQLNKNIAELNSGEVSITVKNFMERPLIKHYIKIAGLQNNIYQSRFITEANQVYDMASGLENSLPGIDTKTAVTETMMHMGAQKFLRDQYTMPGEFIKAMGSKVQNILTIARTGSVKLDDDSEQQVVDGALEYLEEGNQTAYNNIRNEYPEIFEKYENLQTEAGKLLEFGNNKFFKYLETKQEVDEFGEEIFIIKPKRNLIAEESESVKEEIRKAFEELPDWLKNQLLDYQFLRFGINDKIGSLFDMMPQEYNTRLLSQMSRALANKMDYFEQNLLSIKKNTVLKYKNNLRTVKKVNKVSGGYTIDNKNQPYAFINNDQIYIKEGEKFQLLENDNYQTGKYFTKFGTTEFDEVKEIDDQLVEKMNELKKCF